MAPKGKASPADFNDSDEDYDSDDDMPGSSADISTSSLSQSERAAAQAWRRPPGGVMEVEKAPLSAGAKAVTEGAHLTATKTYDYDQKLEGLCASYAKDGTLVAVGCRSGKVLVVNPQTMETVDVLDVSMLSDNTGACTAVKFKSSTPTSSLHNVLLIAQDEQLIHCHVSSGKVVKVIQEKGNKINAVEVRQDGQMFATAGSDHIIRVYDEHRNVPMCRMQYGVDANVAGHSNNVFGLCWKGEDYQVLLSGGWDRTVQIWDIRVGKSVRSIFGPYVCGDALDVRGNKVLTGSWRHSDPLQLWDYGSGQLMTNLPFHQPEPDACLLYTAKFGRGVLDGMIFAGGSGKKPVFRSYAPTGELLGSFHAPSAVHSIDVCSAGLSKVVGVCCAFQLCVLQV